MKIGNKLILMIAVLYFTVIIVICVGVSAICGNYNVPQEATAAILKRIVFIAGVLGIIALISVLFLIKRILSSLNHVQNKMQDLSEHGGDLTAIIDVKKRDETGEIAKSLNGFIESIHAIMKEIQINADQLARSVDSMSISIQSTTDDTTNVSSVMEEISASVQEMTSNIMEIADIMEEMAQSFDDMNEEAKDGANYAQNSNEDAYDIMMRSERERQEVETRANEVEVALKDKIEQSKQVERIMDLTGDIIGIADQTNLLALNASIEAARAGEAGKGFAVVADEITKLAADSMQTANQIKEISNVVITAVTELAEESGNVVDFMKDRTVGSYTQLVEVGRKYQHDSKIMFDKMQDFAHVSESLDQQVNNVTHSVEAIRTAAQESARAVTESAESISKITENMSDIRENCEGNARIADALDANINKFTL